MPPLHPVPGAAATLAREMEADRRAAALSARAQLLLWPKTRGDWCRIARSCSSLLPSSTGAALLGRDEPSVSAARPSALKARMALRAVWRAQRKPAAIARG